MTFHKQLALVLFKFLPFLRRKDSKRKKRKDNVTGKWKCDLIPALIKMTKTKHENKK